MAAQPAMARTPKLLLLGEDPYRTSLRLAGAAVLPPLREAVVVTAEMIEKASEAAALVEDAEARAKMAMHHNAEARKLLDRASALMDEIETLKGNN